MTVEPTSHVPVIVDPRVRPTEQWFALATTRRQLHGGWSILAAKGDAYREIHLQAMLRSRQEALDQALAYSRTSAAGRIYARHLLIPVRYDVMSIEPAHPAKSAMPPFVPMWPRRMPLCGSATEAIERVRILLGKDPEFARKWARHRFVPIRIDDAIQVPASVEIEV